MLVFESKINGETVTAVVVRLSELMQNRWCGIKLLNLEWM